MNTASQSRNYLPGTEIEIINDKIERGKIQHALFDFDGTISLIREGWQKVMIPMCVQFLKETDTDESEEELTEIVEEFVTRLTGKQTIFQMMALKEEIEKRGAIAKEPIEYKHIYLDLLWERIEHRVSGLKSGALKPEDHIVPGAYDILNGLKERGVTCYLASGTDLPFVQDEASVLNVAQYFGEHIYGALDDYKSFSKKMIIQKLIEKNNLSGTELLTFGDGYVEIENTKEVGGIAVGVAADEVRKTGVDEWKRGRLIGVKADLIIPHFGETGPLLDYLFSV